MKDALSGEEKLLRLIKAGKKNPPVSKPELEPSGRMITGDSPGKDESPVFSPGRFNLFRKLTFLGLREYAIVLMICSLLYVVGVFTGPFIKGKKILVTESKEGSTLKGDEFTAGAESSVKPFEFYSQGIGGRKIFSILSSQGASSGAVVLSQDSELIKNISLVGIISGDNPQAVIEDKAAGKSYYLSQGQYLGEVKIEQIKSDRVQLSHKGRTYELFL